MGDVIITETQLSNILDKLMITSEQVSDADTKQKDLVKQQLFQIARLSEEMWQKLDQGEELEDWMETKVGQCYESLISVVKTFMYDDDGGAKDGTNGIDYDDLVIGT